MSQDNGAGAPLHFAVTYRQLDMVCCFCFAAAPAAALGLVLLSLPPLLELCAHARLHAKTKQNHKKVHHLLNLGAPINQRDRSQGWTALHRAARLSHLDGYLEIYEYLLV